MIPLLITLKKKLFGNQFDKYSLGCIVKLTEENKMLEYTVKVDEYGTKSWYLNGKYHREDGPACEYADGTKSWYLNGKRHREDGPAIEWDNGSKFWFLNGEEFSKKKWKKRIKKIHKIIKKTHKIIIDGKEIELSDESFQNLKKAFDNS